MDGHLTVTLPYTYAMLFYVGLFCKVLFNWQALYTFAKFLDRVFPIQQPNSKKRKYWDMLIIVFVLYNAILVPYDAGKPLRDRKKFWW